MTAKEIVAQMTLEEKASLCSGKDKWHLKGIKRLGLEEIAVSDGPHGLRKQEGRQDHLGVNESVPATCFPAACATSCSFDRDLLAEIGEALGEECLEEGVSVILGPAANIKRSPLCGRNFEYISEDPYLAGESAAALIEGIQRKNVGVSLKHYAVNNQEKNRLTSNSVVDERTLREIYLAGFEQAVKKAHPWTLMCSYNLINGVYASENKKLLTEILRDEWGFKGIVMSDWGAVSDRVEGVRAGLDLEMPASDGFNDAKIVEAVKKGKLPVEDLDRVTVRLVEFILKAQHNRKQNYTCGRAAHHALARKAAAQSAVLLKNDGNILPLAKEKSIAVIGAFAQKPRYQGAGSSHINPIKLDNPLEELNTAGYKTEYAPGYKLGKEGLRTDEKLIAEAAALAAKKDIAIVFAGLPDAYESEGFDRENMDMSEAHIRLIEEVAGANANTVVILQCGSPIALPWAPKVKGILLLYLGGEAVGGAVADLVSGKVNPSGKLSETWPVVLEDTPCNLYYPGKNKTAEYRESVFVGYRYYDTAGVTPAYPFGYGLSYTKFAYTGFSLEQDSFAPGGVARVSVTIKNTGKTDGAETVQLYVSPPADSKIMRVKKELKGFEKVFLKAGEEKKVTFVLSGRSFAYYNEKAAAWSVEGGTYTIAAGSSSRDLPVKGELNVSGDGRESLLSDLKEKAPEYFAVKGGGFSIPDSSFTVLYGKPLPPSEKLLGEKFTINSSFRDIQDLPMGQKLSAMLHRQLAGTGESSVADMFAAMFAEMPLRSLLMFLRGKLSGAMLEAIVDSLNGEASPEAAELLKSLG
jgi:beta-glucosidase